MSFNSGTQKQILHEWEYVFKMEPEAEEMKNWLKLCTALAKDPTLVLSTHVRCLKKTVMPAPGNPMLSSGLGGYYSIHTHTLRNKNNIFKIDPEEHSITER